MPVHNLAVLRAPLSGQAANCNGPTPQGDRWAHLIMAWSAVTPSLGLVARDARMRGWDFDLYVDYAIEVLTPGRTEAEARAAAQPFYDRQLAIWRRAN